MNMFKKIFTLSALAAAMVSSSAYAGFYTGAGFGVRPLSANFTKMIVAGVKVDNLNLSVVKPAGDLFVGYQHVFNHGIFLAGELYYEYVNMNASVGVTVQALGQNINERVSAELNYNVNVSTLLGYETSNKDVIYTRVGLLFDDLKYRAASQVQGISSDSVEGSSYAGAIQLGLGIIHPFNKHWAVRGEYTYSRYPNVGVDIKVNLPVVGSQSIVQFTPRVSINAVTASLLYSF
jgi:opacity protein-like surface antigen